MNLRLILISACASLFLPACTSVLVPEPLGEKPVVLDSSWEGSWLTNDGVVKISVLNSEQGLLQFAAIESGPEGMSLDIHNVILKQKDDVVYASTRDDEVENLYHWAIVDRESDSQILAWGPDAERFKLLISEEKFPGRFQKPGDEHNDNVVLGELKPEHMEMINDPASGLIDWKSPIVMIKLSD